MRYQRTHVKAALVRAREAGHDCAGLASDLRETELQLERWGFLPIPGNDDLDKKVAEWYVAQGLAAPMAGEQRPRKTAAPDTPAVIMSAPPQDAALVAAEAALAAAQAALAYARAVTPPAA